MTSQPHKQGRANTDAVLAFAAMGLILVVVLVAALAVLAVRISGAADGMSAADWLHHPVWSTRTTIAFCGMAVLPLLLIAGAVSLVVRGRRNRKPGDDMARYMSSRKDIEQMSEKTVLADTIRLRAAHAGIGLMLGWAVLTRTALWGTFEFSQLWIMGTRAGKTRHVAVRQIVQHKGPVLATSNKPDVHAYCRGMREEQGTVWVQDPQDIIGEEATWYWNPLTYVTNAERARKLASVFAAARTAGTLAATDPYFEPQGQRIAAQLLLAAAVAKKPIIDLTDWLVGDEPRPGVDDPVKILRKHGYEAAARNLSSIRSLAEETRSSLYGVAASLFGFLDDPRYVSWISKMGEDDTRPEFLPSDFVRSTDALFLASQEGEGSARAITGALVEAVYQAGVEYARASGGRCPTPILFLLDEAANICKLPDLPDWLSHAGGQGIIIVTILQSAQQGREGWGDSGFQKMVGATNLMVVGRGQNDAAHLRDLVALIGDYEDTHRSQSVGTKGHRSTSTDVRDRRIFTEADLRAMPAGRAILMAAGVRPILMETRDFTTETWADKIQASIDYYGSGQHRKDARALQVALSTQQRPDVVDTTGDVEHTIEIEQQTEAEAW